METKKCKTCGYLHPQHPVCQLRREQVDPIEDFCSKHREIYELTTCCICGEPVLNINLLLDVQEDGTIRYMHTACGHSLNTCGACQYRSNCEFETNPDPMPKVVMQTIRQGNMVMQTQIRNPDRIRKFCHECPCFDPENECLKQFNCCGKYIEKTTP